MAAVAAVVGAAMSDDLTDGPGLVALPPMRTDQAFILITFGPGPSAEMTVKMSDTAPALPSQVAAAATMLDEHARAIFRSILQAQSAPRVQPVRVLPGGRA